MKNLYAIALIAVISWPLFFNTGVFSYYNINIKSFTEKYCSNKSQPELRCNGKCHLKSIVISSNANQKDSKNKSTRFLRLPLFISPLFDASIKAKNCNTAAAWQNIEQAKCYSNFYNEVPVPPPRV